MIEDDELLEKYNTVWDKASLGIRKEFDRELFYNKIFLKTKIKFHGDKITNFYDKKNPEADSNYTCLAIISLDSVLNKDGNYYSQVFWKECKYIGKRITRHVNDDLSDFSYCGESGEK